MITASPLFTRVISSIALLGVLWGGGTLQAHEVNGRELARKILADENLTEVLERARAIIRTGFNAGDGYSEVWIRDLATFIELACEVQDLETIREALVKFFRFQGDDGNIIDGYISSKEANTVYNYIQKKSIPGFLGHKNTVETDQESSLIQAVYKYIRKTGDDSLLETVVDGLTVKQRMATALEYLLRERFSEKHGLLWGGTTADWGDVQPEHDWGVVLDDNSHRAIDIYDNAMFLIAIENIVELSHGDDDVKTKWQRIHKEIHENVRKHLWDAKLGKFIPHIYLEGSPFPVDFDEQAIYYHGGTAVAIEAGLLSREEIALSLAQMVDNVAKSGATSIGLTLYPPYPDGYFKNPILSQPYTYQNGGDWTWFGGRMIQQLTRNGFVEEAYRELQPMVDRVRENKGFYEWYTREGKPAGSSTYRGSAGVLAKAIQMLQEWAEKHQL